MPVIKHQEVCSMCDGTGLYIGMAEKSGAAIICHNCDGNGEVTFIHKYKELRGGRVYRYGIRRVFKKNPGILIVEDSRYKLEDFGGMPYEDWYAGKSFPKQHEMRFVVCPAWWYRKINWDECNTNLLGSRYSDCKFFNQKKICWSRWDQERNNEGV
ncbi:MAG: hypothetical protein GWN14_05175 [candidate division Zixibacteria bacterium]|nr:hypothetical protein [candidate division Zixibacteria bacterium]